MPENPTLAEYDAQHPETAAAEPTPDPRVVALQALVDAEKNRTTARWRPVPGRRLGPSAGVRRPDRGRAVTAAQIVAAFLSGATVPALLGWLRARRAAPRSPRDPQLIVRSTDGTRGDWYRLEPGARVDITVTGTWTTTRDDDPRKGLPLRNEWFT